MIIELIVRLYGPFHERFYSIFNLKIFFFLKIPAQGYLPQLCQSMQMVNNDEVANSAIVVLNQISENSVNFILIIRNFLLFKELCFSIVYNTLSNKRIFNLYKKTT